MKTNGRTNVDQVNKSLVKETMSDFDIWVWKAMKPDEEQWKNSLESRDEYLVVLSFEYWTYIY
jgi:hypothetical protein